MEDEIPDLAEIAKKVRSMQGGMMPDFYLYVRENPLKETLGKYLKQMQEMQSRNPGKQIAFPIAEFGLSCYIQGHVDLFECMSELGILDMVDDVKNAVEGKMDPNMERVLEIFEKMRQAWLQLKFDPPGNVLET